MRILCTGSSHRKGSRGWTDVLAVRRFLISIHLPSRTPITIIHGASRSKGADHLVDVEAERIGILREAYPVAPCDGNTRAAPIKRNIRMERDSHPHVGAAFVIGNVGEAVGTNGHYLTNGSDHMTELMRSHGKAVVVYRENGVEPCKTIAEARMLLLALWRAGLYCEDIGRAGLAVRTALDKEPDAIIAARNAVESLRLTRPVLAPWLAPVEMALTA